MIGRARRGNDGGSGGLEISGGKNSTLKRDLHNWNITNLNLEASERGEEVD